MDARSMALANLANVALDRQRFTNQQYAREMAQQRQYAKQGYEDQTEGGMNWLNTAGTGAMVGGSTGNPWAALAGGVIGAGLGIYQGMKTRQQGGPGHKKMGAMSALGSTLTHPMGRRMDGISDIPIMQAGALAGKFGGSQAPIAGDSQGASQGGLDTNPDMSPEQLDQMHELQMEAQRQRSLAANYGGGWSREPITRAGPMGSSSGRNILPPGGFGRGY